jgi:hypothetical protein
MVIERTAEMVKNDETLFGINNIKPLVGGHSESTILKWKREYPSFPIRKLRGVWVANRELLVDWFRRFCMGDIEDSPVDGGCNHKKQAKPKVKRKANR